MQKIIHGIQQIGVGVSNVVEASKWYAETLNADIQIFDDSAVAKDMAPFMGGVSEAKRAIMLMNLNGGSGFEIWQYTNRVPQKAKYPFQLGNFGINYSFLKSGNVEQTYNLLETKGVKMLTPLIYQSGGELTFFFSDPYDNIYQVKDSKDFFKKNAKNQLGSIYGCTIGVSDIDQSLKLYRDILGYDEVVYDNTGVFDDFNLLGEEGAFRRILLTHKKDRKGGFSPLLGKSQIELIERLDGNREKVFKDRQWGDLGFIHLCFDVKYFDSLVQECAEKSFPFKVISDDSFDMGGTKSKWGYIEDNDGTLLEFVETYRLPLFFGINLDLKNQPPYKNVHNWMIKALRLKKRKK